MVNQIVNTVIRYRSGNSTDWASSNIVLQQGEPGYELDTHKIKIGDGVTAYNDLPYVAGDGDLSLLEQHLKDFNNPHQVTKDQVGLSNVDNTSDVNKPVSTAQAAAISQVEAIANDAQSEITNHVANTSNPHQVTKAQVGLGNVDNIADASQQVHGQRQVSSDLNSYTDSGWYYGVSGNSCANKPSNVDTFTLVVYKLSSTLCTQVLFDPANISGNTLYVRSLNNTTWGSWSPYATISDIPTNISSLNNDAGYIKNQSGAFSYDNLSNNPIPDPTSSDAGKVVAVNSNGNGFDLVEPASGGSDVVANPEDQATDELTKLGVDGITYSIPSTLMTVSDVDDPNAIEIKTIAFGGDKYRFPSGGGGTGGGITQVTIDASSYISMADFVSAIKAAIPETEYTKFLGLSGSVNFDITIPSQQNPKGFICIGMLYMGPSLLFNLFPADYGGAYSGMNFLMAHSTNYVFLSSTGEQEVVTAITVSGTAVVNKVS